MRFLRALLLAAGLLFLPVASFAQVGVSVSFGPPELPVYAQPVCPGDGYIWTPGYWAWDGDDYYWVPGTWVEAPEVGFFWTPGYWGWGGSAFIFHEGYWGPHIGFYGGINYGYGYFGRGYEGGRWDNGHFYYNRAVNNVNVTVVHNVYETRVVNETRTRVSYNGGTGGINERPTREEETYSQERHVPPVSAQTQHVASARSNPELRASANHGKPPIAATSKPGAFHEATPASEGHYNPPAKSETGAGRTNTSTETRSNNEPARSETNTAHTTTPVHPKDLPPVERHPATTTGNTKTDQKYQQQQAKLSAQQDKQRQQLQQNQEKEHQQLQQQKANDAKNQQVEQKHQQQTQQLQQKHVQQQQHLEQKQQPAHQAAPASAPKEKH